MKKFYRKSETDSAVISRAALIEKEILAIKAANEQHNFIERFIDLKFVFKFFLLPLIVIWSVGTESVFLYSNFIKTLNSVGAAVALVILIVLIIEGGKMWTGLKFVKFFTHAWLSKGWYYVAFFITLAILFICFYGGSFFMSIKGAPISADFFTKETNELILVDLEEINTYYDQKIADEKEKQSSAHTQTWKGHLTKKGAALSTSIQATINTIEEQRNIALAEARTTNAMLQDQYNNGISERGTWFQRFAGIGEILQIIILILLQIYSRASYLELPEEPNENSESTLNQPLEIAPMNPILEQVSKLDSIKNFKVDAPIILNEATEKPQPMNQIGFKTANKLESTGLKVVSIAKKKKTPKKKATRSNYIPIKPIPLIKEKEIPYQIRERKRRIGQCKWKLRNNHGRAETAHKNIETCEREIAELEEMLKEIE